MDIDGERLKVTFVKSTDECARKCWELALCDSFWCYTGSPLEVTHGATKSCHLMKNGKYRKADHKTAGICSKGKSVFLIMLRKMGAGGVSFVGR